MLLLITTVIWLILARLILSILIVRCGYFSLSSFTREILSPRKKRQTIINLLTGTRGRILNGGCCEHKAASCIRGYHIYRDIWTAAIGEELDCVRESGNIRDRYAVAVKRPGVTVGHLPPKISRLLFVF